MLLRGAGASVGSGNVSIGLGVWVSWRAFTCHKTVNGQQTSNAIIDFCAIVRKLFQMYKLWKGFLSV